MFGDDAKVQRCRNHKMRNVTGHLPKDQEAQARSTLRAAFKLGGKEGRRKLEQYAGWLEKDWPSAAASLREGLDELFTIDDLDLLPMLKRCLGTTNIIDNPHSAARHRIDPAQELAEREDCGSVPVAGLECVAESIA